MSESKGMPPEHPSSPGFFYGYAIVGLAFFILLIAYGMYYSFGIFFKPLLEEFGWTRAMTSGAVSSAMVLEGFMCIAIGGLTDRYGPRVVLSMSGIVLGVGCILMSRVTTLWQLYVFYGVLVGVGMAGPLIALLWTIARWFVKRRGLMSGIVTAGIGMGAVVVPPIGTYLISAFDWRTSYLIIGVAVLVITVLAAQFHKSDPSKVGQTPYGFAGQAAPVTAEKGALFAVGRDVRTLQFWLVLANFFAFGFCLYVVIVHIVPYAIDTGVTPVQAASVMSVVGGASIIGKVATGYISDAIGPRRTFMISFMVMAGAFIWLVFARQFWMLQVFAVVFGFAYGGCVAPQAPIVAELFGLRGMGTIFGLASFAFTMGGAVGPFVAGYTFDVGGSYTLAMLIAALVALLGFGVTALVRPLQDAAGPSRT